MFPLYTSTFPTSADALAERLNASVQKLFAHVDEPVTIRDENYPRLAEIRVTLDGAELRANPPRPPAVQGAGTAGVHVGELHISAAEMLVGPARASIRLDARQVLLDQAPDSQGEIVLVLKSAADGRVEVTAPTKEIENAIAAFARQEAARHGVAIEQVQLSLQPRGDRNVDAEVRVQARKLFFTTTIRIAAKLDLDPELEATISGLRCHGEGAVGSLACGFLQPHLQKMEGRSFPLMALPLGEVRLRDVRLAVGDLVAVMAEFGA